jgi:hypothetical protein
VAPTTGHLARVPDTENDRRLSARASGNSLIPARISAASRGRRMPGGEGSAVPQLEPGHCPPAAPPPPPRGQARHQPKPQPPPRPGQRGAAPAPRGRSGQRPPPGQPRTLSSNPDKPQNRERRHEHAQARPQRRESANRAARHSTGESGLSGAFPDSCGRGEMDLGVGGKSAVPCLVVPRGWSSNLGTSNLIESECRLFRLLWMMLMVTMIRCQIPPEQYGKYLRDLLGSVVCSSDGYPEAEAGQA